MIIFTNPSFFEFNRITIHFFLIFKKYLKKQLKDLIKQLQRIYPDFEIVIEHWYNFEGLDDYLYFDFVIPFGTPGRPGKYLEIINDITAIPLDVLHRLSEKEQVIQLAE